MKCAQTLGAIKVQLKNLVISKEKIYRLTTVNGLLPQGPRRCDQSALAILGVSVSLLALRSLAWPNHSLHLTRGSGTPLAGESQRLDRSRSRCQAYF